MDDRLGSARRGAQPADVEIRTVAGKCFEVRGADPADLTLVVQFPCNGRNNRLFRIV